MRVRLAVALPYTAILVEHDPDTEVNRQPTRLSSKVAIQKFTCFSDICLPHRWILDLIGMVGFCPLLV